MPISDGHLVCHPIEDAGELSALAAPSIAAMVGFDEWPARVGAFSTPGRRHSDAAWCEHYTAIVTPRLGRLRRLARRILRSDDLADDAVQEALLSLWQERRVPPNVDGWLVRAVVHRSLHLNRSRRRRRVYEGRASARRPERDPSCDASRPLELAEAAGAIDAALAALPELLRAVFVLRMGEGLDYTAIAESLRIPVGTVRSRLHRAREAIRDALGDGGGPAIEGLAGGHAVRMPWITRGTLRSDAALPMCEDWPPDEGAG